MDKKNETLEKINSFEYGSFLFGVAVAIPCRWHVIFGDDEGACAPLKPPVVGIIVEPPSLEV